MSIIRKVLAAPRDRAKLVAEVAEMRARMAAAHPNPPLWEVKHLRGGLVDVEFIAQYLELRAASRHPEVLRQNTEEALVALAEAEALPGEAARALRTALALWRNVQGMLKLLVEEEFEEAAATDALKTALARVAGAVDFPSLKTDMLAAAGRVRGLFAELVELPAEELRQQTRGEIAE